MTEDTYPGRKNYPGDYSWSEAQRLVDMLSSLPQEERWRAVRDEANGLAHWCAAHRVSPFDLPIPNRVWVVNELISRLGKTKA